MCPQFFFLLGVEACGGAFPLLGAAWVGLRPRLLRLLWQRVFFVSLFLFLFVLFFVFFICRGLLGWSRWARSGCTVAPRIRSLQALDLVDIRISCPVAGRRRRGCLLWPVSGCPLRGSFSPTGLLYPHTPLPSGSCRDVYIYI